MKRHRKPKLAASRKAERKLRRGGAHKSRKGAVENLFGRKTKRKASRKAKRGRKRVTHRKARR